MENWQSLWAANITHYNWSFTMPPDVRLCSGFVGAYLNKSYLVWVSNVYCIPIIAFVGVLCNLLNVVTLCHKHARLMPSSLYLQTLALCDCCFLIFGTLEVTPVTLDILSLNPVFNYYYTHSVLYIRTIASTCYKASVLLVVAFNVERYICVCHPLDAARYCNTKMARLVVAGALLSSLAFSTQWPICHQIDSCFNIFTNDTYYMVRVSSEGWLQIYYKCMDYLSMILFNIVPIIILFTLNGFLIRTLRRVMSREQERQQPQQTSKSNSRDSHRRGSSFRRYAAAWNANAILGAVVLMFVVCLGPQVPARLLIEIYGADDELMITYMAISQQLIFLNASLNFCLYCLVSRKYRLILRKTLKKLVSLLSGRPVSSVTYVPRKTPASVNADLVEARRLMNDNEPKQKQGTMVRVAKPI